MPVSKFLLTLSMFSIGLMAACAGPGTYPITGDKVSSDDPVQEMFYNPGLIFRGESR
ncbi:hypothetical protein HW561_06865 [Rhodobacteraceae bacterium B1Z28]|uniref:Lipoprotein n=1 Tax=Ruegeria haliotis TaxID=2747601 RepID=A0ABX2PQ16_9RHOB|nr:hypothetical protein [Ruegeria haliotis]NVO55506.1 hypothetical protein [Ruegeria haliotis]